MELFCKNSQPPKHVNYFRKKAPLQMFDEIPNVTPIGEKVLYMLGEDKLQVHGICSRKEAVETRSNYKRACHVW